MSVIPLNKKVVFVIFISFIAYITVNNIYFYLAKLITIEPELNHPFFYLKGSLCAARGPDSSSGPTYAVFLFLKMIPAIVLLVNYVKKDKSLKAYLAYAFINYYLFDFYSLLSFIILNYYSCDSCLYGFSSVHLFVASKVFTGNYLVIPISTSLIGVILFSLYQKITLLNKYLYISLTILSILASYLFFKFLGILLRQ